MWMLSKNDTGDMEKVLKLLRPQVRKWQKRYSADAIAAALAQVALRDLAGSSPSCQMLELTIGMLNDAGTDPRH
jgi:hypothetical protein